MRTITLTVEELHDFFRAGVRQGEDQATAADWGCRANTSEALAEFEAVRDLLGNRKDSRGLGAWIEDHVVEAILGQTKPKR